MGQLVFQATLGGAVNLIGPNTASTINFTLPSADGTSGQALATNGTGTLAFSSFATLVSNTFTGSQTLSGGTANGVTYLNGSKVLTSGSALTFDGTNFGVNSSSTIDGGRLSVAFSGSTQNGIGLKDTADASGASFLGAYNSTNGFIGSLRRSGTDNALAINGNSYLAFQQNSTEQMRLTSTGLGIGTSSPSASFKLDVTGLIRSNATANGGGQFTIAKSGTTVGVLCGSGNVIGSAATDLALYAETGNAVSIFTNGSATARATFDTSGNLLLGVTSSTGLTGTGDFAMPNNRAIRFRNAANSAYLNMIYVDTSNNLNFGFGGVPPNITFGINGIGEVSRFDSSGNLLVGTTNTNPGGADVNGIALIPGGFSVISALGVTPFGINRGTNDGTLINFSQAGTTEGTISVSGTTVSYNGGHLSRYAQTTTAKDNSLVKGTVLSNLDEMNVYTKDGQPVDNEQLNKVKVSDTEGDVNVAGVFVNWSHDEDHNVDEINMAMTGDMIIRIAQGVTVIRGDLLMSAGDGTAKPQGDDIIRSKTVAKVTSNHVTCTYADGSFCVPCVLMAC